MPVAGPLDVLADRLNQYRDRKDEERREQRNLQVNDIETAIQGISNRTDLSPQEKAFQINEARNKITGLYHPHEAGELMQVLHRIRGGGAPTAVAGDKSTVTPGASVNVGGVQMTSPSTKLTLKPGMTVGDIISSGGTQPQHPQGMTAVTKTPVKGADGKFYLYYQDPQGNIVPKEIPGYSEQTLKQQYIDAGLSEEDAEKAVKVHFGIEPKAGATKAAKITKEGDGFTITDGESVYSSKKQIPADRKDLKELWDDTQENLETERKRKDDEEDRKENSRMNRMLTAFSLAIQRGDHADARKIVNSAITDEASAELRRDTMHQNFEDALRDPANPNQQAMLSLLANHLGMTGGVQKGMRITKAMWEEAASSLPWFDDVMKRFSTTDKNGDRVFTGALSGITLSRDQMQSMVDLADQKTEFQKRLVQKLKDAHSEDLNVGKPKEKAAKEPKTGKTIQFTQMENGKMRTWKIPESDAPEFRRSHPKAQEKQEL